MVYFTLQGFYWKAGNCATKLLKEQTLCKMCPNTEFFLVCISLYLVRMRENTDQKNLHIWTLFTRWKISIEKPISGPYFRSSGLNTERYFVSLSIQSEYWKIRTRKNSVFRHISHIDLRLKGPLHQKYSS